MKTHILVHKRHFLATYSNGGRKKTATWSLLFMATNFIHEGSILRIYQSAKLHFHKCTTLVIQLSVWIWGIHKHSDLWGAEISFEGALNFHARFLINFFPVGTWWPVDYYDSFSRHLPNSKTEEGKGWIYKVSLKSKQIVLIGEEETVTCS